MPTMRQTGINPQTSQILRGERSIGNNDTTNNNKRPSSSSSFVPIRTPSALLARDPQQLSSTLHVSLESVKRLRATVAECVVMDPNVGHAGRALEVIHSVDTFCCRNENRDCEDYLNDSSEQQHQHQQQQKQQVEKRPPPITIGAVTALDLYAQSLLLKRIYNSKQLGQQNYIRTGSAALDQLLLPNTEYHLFEESWDPPSPFCIPDNHNVPTATAATATNTTESNNNGSGGGIPFGQITELSGKTASGKTQLALSITAHALVENNLQVKYIIGGGSSSRMAISRRLYAVCTGVARRHLLQNGYYENHENVEREARSMAGKCLERVTVSSVLDAYSLLGSLAQLEKEESISITALNDNNSNKNHEGTLVVIDSISGCLGHHIYSDRTLGASLSNQVSLTLRRLTRSYDGNFNNKSSSSSIGCGARSSTNVDDLWENPPRRFAVLVVNGTVGKSASDGSKITSFTPPSSSHKPAMGRYWHGGDMCIWLDSNDEDLLNERETDNSSLAMMQDGSIAGLYRSKEKIVTASLQWHYSKSVGVEQSHDGRVKFAIQADGVVDVE